LQSSLVSLVRIPEWCQIHPKAFEAHGISREECNKYGISFDILCMVFNEMVLKSDYQIAHNIKFDTLMIEKTANVYFQHPVVSFKNAFCTMEKTTDICKLKGKNGSYKWPKLNEAYKHFFNREVENAHDALADCNACFDIFKKLLAH